MLLASKPRSNMPGFLASQSSLQSCASPTQEVGLPDGFENLDVLHFGEQAGSFLNAIDILQKPIEEYLEEQKPPPSCLISNSLLPWTCQTAENFDIPRIVFHGMCCFSLSSWFNLRCFNSHESVTSDSELFPIPGLNHHIEITKSQLPPVVNSFSELENEYVGYCGKALWNKKVWTIGSVSLCNKDMLVKAARGNRAAISQHECLKWLDLRKLKSVVYVSFGSLCRLGPSQLMQIGLALEASKKPFIWVIRGVVEPEEIEKWITVGFEDRTKETGLIIRGWAPQILILSHPAIGGFLTHCGWNSTMESICAGVPMITWPLFGEQVLNEKLVVNVLKIGVDLGILRCAMWWNPVEKLDVLVTMEEISKAVERAATLALACLRTDPQSRPTMWNVSHRLSVSRAPIQRASHSITIGHLLDVQV
ncbi:hypothetical protein ACLOJK_041358 [Asimina triloba]